MSIKYIETEANDEVFYVRDRYGDGGGGASVFFPEKMKRVINKVIEMPDKALQKFGFVLMLTGLFLVYLGKS